MVRNDEVSSEDAPEIEMRHLPAAAFPECNTQITDIGSAEVMPPLFGRTSQKSPPGHVGQVRQLGDARLEHGHIAKPGDCVPCPAA